MKNNNNFGYLVREGTHGVFRHGFMSFAAVCVTVACLLIVGIFSLLLYNINQMVHNLEQENEVLVYIDATYSQAEAKSVGTQLNLINNIQNAVFVSREQALEDFVEEQGNANLFEGVDATTFRDRFVVSLEDNNLMQETVEAMRQVEGVADISAPYEIAEGFLSMERVLQIVSVAIIAVLLVVSLFIISNTVKLAMYDRRDEIAIMKIVGATNGFIRLPFVVEGFFLGIIGAAVAFFLEWGLYDLLSVKIGQVDYLKLFQLVPFGDVLIIMVATFAIAGLFVGIFGSLMSIRKFLDV